MKRIEQAFVSDLAGPEVLGTYGRQETQETAGRLAIGAAHDLNNLLAPIVGVLDILERRTVGDDALDPLVRGASRAALAARALVKQILVVGQPVPDDTAPVDLAVQLTAMTDLLRNAPPPKVSLVLQVPENLPLVRISPLQLELSILNLVMNARDAMPHGGSITISATREGHQVVLTVADSGMGMSAETLARATEAYFTTKAVGKGTGLGLHMARRFAEQSGGTLDIASVVDEGTRITLAFPIITA